MHPNTLHTQVVAPYDCEDARGLLKSAIRDPDPVIVLENEILYGETFPLSDAAMDKEFLIPLGKAKVRRGRSGRGQLAPATARLPGRSLGLASLGGTCRAAVKGWAS